MAVHPAGDLIQDNTNSDITTITNSVNVFPINKATKAGEIQRGVTQTDNLELTVSKTAKYKVSGNIYAGRAGGSGGNAYWIYVMVDLVAMRLVALQGNVNTQRQPFPFETIMTLNAGEAVTLGVLNSTDSDDLATSTASLRLEEVLE